MGSTHSLGGTVAPTKENNTKYPQRKKEKSPCPSVTTLFSFFSNRFSFPPYSPTTAELSDFKGVG